jgi:hypothetical protein
MTATTAAPRRSRSTIGEGRRDTGIDAVRAIAIAGVVLGHWLVTAIVLGSDGALRVRSPLETVPALRPASWLFQTLGLFFFAAGYAAATRTSRSRGIDLCEGRESGIRATETARSRRSGWRRLVVAVARLVVPLGLALAVAAALEVPEPTLRTVGTLAVSPLWFLLPYFGFTALARPITIAVRRVGPAPIAVAAAAVVLAADRGLGVLPLTLGAAWLVPYVLGVGLASGPGGGRRAPRLMLLGAAAAVVALIGLGYPDSAVGVPGAARSNLDPPSLAAVALAVAQVGAALLALPWLRRHAGRAVAALNRHATTVYLWHQPTLVATAVAAAWLSGGRPVPGVLNPPGVGWLADRLAWMGAGTLTVALFLRVARPVYDHHRFASPARPTEVIAVRNSDPPSRSRATAQPR